MDEAFYIELVKRSLTEKLDPHAQETLSAWLQADPENRALADGIRVIWSKAENYQADYQADKAAGLEKVRRFMDQNSERSPEDARVIPIGHGFKKWGSLAAALMILVAMAGVITWYFHSYQIHTHHIQTIAQEQKEILLEDGTKIFLDGQSSLEYPAKFRGSTREVLLTGQAFFEVAHNPEQPFIVQTTKTSVKVLGTSFQVQAKAGNTTIVQVATGKVRFQPKGSSRFLDLVAGEEAAYDSNKQILQKNPKSNPNAYAWHSGRLQFRDAPLGQVLLDLENHFGVSLSLQDPALAECRFNANFDLNQSKLEDILRVLETTFKMESSNQPSGGFLFIGGSCK